MSKIVTNNITPRSGGNIDVTGKLSVSGNVTGAAATFTGNVSVGGTLTYEDVTNIDSVGVITARSGIKVLAGGINAVGVVTATSFVGNLTGNLTGNATGLSGTPNITVGVVTAASFVGNGASITNIDAGNIATGIVTSARLGGGTASADTFLNGDGQFAETGGAWNLVATVNASGASAATFQGNLDSTYKQYVVVISEVVSDGTTNSELRFNYMVGATELTGSFYDSHAIRKTISTTILSIGQNNAAWARLTNAGLDADNPDHLANITLWLNGGRNSKSHNASFVSTNTVAEATFTYMTGMVQYFDTTTRAVDGIKFFTSSDTFTGTFKLYGLN